MTGGHSEFCTFATDSSSPMESRNEDGFERASAWPVTARSRGIRKRTAREGRERRAKNSGAQRRRQNFNRNSANVCARADDGGVRQNRCGVTRRQTDRGKAGPPNASNAGQWRTPSPPIGRMSLRRTAGGALAPAANLSHSPDWGSAHPKPVAAPVAASGPQPPTALRQRINGLNRCGGRAQSIARNSPPSATY